MTIVRETGRSIAEVARELGIGAGTLGNWVKKDRLARRAVEPMVQHLSYRWDTPQLAISSGHPPFPWRHRL